MDFPRTNKIPQLITEKVSDNAKLLEELYDAINWKKLLYFYMRVFGIFLVSLFLVIVVVRLALLIP